MLTWLRAAWLALWTDRPFSVRSPLTVEAAVAALNADRASGWTRLGLSTRGSGPRNVTGRVGADHVRLTSSRMGRNNAWRPELRARFTPRPDGCELTGYFSAPRHVQTFSALWLGGAIGLPLCGSIGSGSLGALLTALAVGLGMATAGLAIMTVGATMGRSDEEHLRGWAERRLRGSRSGEV